MTSRLIYLIKRAEIEITARMGKALEPNGLTPIQFTLLYFIDITKGDLSSAQLSRRFSVTPQSMNELVQVLQKKELIKRSVDPMHKRILRINVTRKGKVLIDKSNKFLDGLEASLLEDLTEDQRASLRKLIGLVLESARRTPQEV